MDENRKSQFIREMYEGERRRDASSSIRGFLFQDLIAVNWLTKEDTQSVYSEWIEDITVVTEKEIYIIQAKYYPKSDIESKFKKIVRDLYYQYLRLEIKGCEFKVIPVLAVHGRDIPPKPTLEEMRKTEYINVQRGNKPDWPEDAEKWLKENVYGQKNAEDRLFGEFAWDGSMKKFLEDLCIDSSYPMLSEYKKQVVKDLGQLPFQGCVITEDDRKKDVLLGLAIQYVQEKYYEENAREDAFLNRRCGRDAFLEYLGRNVCTDDETSIGAYLRTVVVKCLGEIEKSNPSMAQEKLDMLIRIGDNTAEWLFGLGCSARGQLQILNTVSARSKDDFAGFCEKSIARRRDVMCEHYDVLCVFLRYLWKIIVDINQNLIGKDLQEDDWKRLKPQRYIDEQEQRYIAFHFPKDMAGEATIITDIQGALESEKVTNVFERMEEVRPDKWYMGSSYKGRYSYELKVSEIETGHTVSEKGPNQFCIECMNCIQIGKNQWDCCEDCSQTIFLDHCVKDRGEER